MYSVSVQHWQTAGVESEHCRESCGSVDWPLELLRSEAAHNSVILLCTQPYWCCSGFCPSTAEVSCPTGRFVGTFRSSARPSVVAARGNQARHSFDNFRFDVTWLSSAQPQRVPGRAEPSSNPTSLDSWHYREDITDCRPRISILRARHYAQRDVRCGNSVHVFFLYVSWTSLLCRL